MIRLMMMKFTFVLDVVCMCNFLKVIPAVHYAIAEGWFKAMSHASLGWLILMGCLYILGAVFYALRVPERFFPGKFDIWVSEISFEVFTIQVVCHKIVII